MDLQELIDKYLKDAEFDPRETEWLATPKDFAEEELSKFAIWCAAQQRVQPDGDYCDCKNYQPSYEKFPNCRNCGKPPRR